MKARSKFYGIHYPLFGLREVPYNYSIGLDSITIQKQEDKKIYVVDTFKKGVPLLARYVAVKEDDFSFDFTCLSTSQVITKKVKWGIDSKANIYNLSKKQTFKARNVPIIAVKGNLIWVATVSYPFKIQNNLIDNKELLDQFLTIVYVDEVWQPFKFTSFSEQIEEITL